jgi:hypothetical protein
MFVVRWKSFMPRRVSMFQEMSLHILMHLNSWYSIWKCKHIDECLSKRSTISHPYFVLLALAMRYAGTFSIGLDYPALSCGLQIPE